MEARDQIDAERAQLEDQASADQQEGLFDQVIENDLLNAALERREKANEDKKAAVGKYKEAHDAAKAQIEALELGEETVVRCGRFRIQRAAVKGHSVSFETDDTSRLKIKLLSDK